MSEPAKNDHWGELAKSMGIEPPLREEQPPLAEESDASEDFGATVSAPQPAPSAARRQRPPSPQRASGNWDLLASELGIAPPPAPSPPPRAAVLSEPATAEPVSQEPPPAEPISPMIEVEARIAEDLEADDEARLRSEAWESQLVEVSDPVFVDAAESASEEEGEIASEPAPQERPERGDRKKRRRKRRKGRRPVDAATEPAEDSAEPRIESVSADSGPAERYLGDVLDEPLPDATAADEGSADEEERRESRKRRRRRKKKRPAVEREPAHAEAEGEQWSGEEQTGDEDREIDHDEEHEDEDVGRLSHRAIPTWEQAIGLIVARNLDARAKRPNGGRGTRRRDQSGRS